VGEVAAGVTGWLVRRAEIEDAASVARIQVAGWRAAYADIVPAEFLAGMDKTDRVALWQKRLRAPEPAATFVAVDERNEIAAYCVVGALRTERGKGEPGMGELMAIYADPARHRRGAGRAVHDAGLDHLRRRGFDRAGLWVFSENADARAFYAACGWAPDGVTHDDEIAGRVIPEARYTRLL
jgi:ribosomal protein S18 acetylase RimI-like enzyme